MAKKTLKEQFEEHGWKVVDGKLASAIGCQFFELFSEIALREKKRRDDA